MATDSRLDEVLERLDAGLSGAVERLRTFLRIPSISTDPAHAGDVRTADRQWARAERVGESNAYAFAASPRPGSTAAGASTATSAG